MAPPHLLLQDVSLTHGGKPLLEEATLSASAGERLCLVGWNGSGKSTLLKVAVGLIAPDTSTRDGRYRTLAPDKYIDRLSL